MFIILDDSFLWNDSVLVSISGKLTLNSNSKLLGVLIIYDAF